jgi:hypothetical protein
MGKIDRSIAPWQAQERTALRSRHAPDYGTVSRQPSYHRSGLSADGGERRAAFRHDTPAMASNAREMRLTAELVAQVAPLDRDPGPLPSDLVLASEADHEAAIGEILAGAPARDAIWVFAYGSLIWKPAHESVEQRVALAHGWHRSFCLGWITRFRGSVERPG